MDIKDRAFSARGFVNPSFIDLSSGKQRPFDIRHNTLSYMSAEAMAAAFGGDPSYIPAKIGFVYGDRSSVDMSPITRSQDWDSFTEELGYNSGGTNIDVQIVDFSYPPTLGGENPAAVPSDSSSSGSESGSDSGSGSDKVNGDYNHILPGGSNAITFHAVSNSLESGTMGLQPFVTGDFIYQTVLLGYNHGNYYIISRASMYQEKYLQKPKGFEVALDWTVVFN